MNAASNRYLPSLPENLSLYACTSLVCGKEVGQRKRCEGFEKK